jgi:hypothetical protein
MEAGAMRATVCYKSGQPLVVEEIGDKPVV